MSIKQIENKIRREADNLYLTASCKIQFHPHGGEKRQRLWYFKDHERNLQSPKNGLNDNEAFKWLEAARKEEAYQCLLYHQIFLPYQLTDYLPEGLRLGREDIDKLHTSVVSRTWRECALDDNIKDCIQKIVDEYLKEYNIKAE